MSDEFDDSSFEDLDYGDVEDGGLDLEDSGFEEMDFEETDFEEADFEESDFEEADFEEADFEESDFEEADFEETDFEEGDFEEADFEESDFEETDFEETDLKEADFEEEDFEEEVFEETDLEESDFEEADFEETAFEESDSEETGFEEADFEESDSGEAGFEETDFEGSDSEETDLEESDSGSGEADGETSDPIDEWKNLEEDSVEEESASENETCEALEQEEDMEESTESMESREQPEGEEAEESEETGEAGETGSETGRTEETEFEDGSADTEAETEKVPPEVRELLEELEEPETEASEIPPEVRELLEELEEPETEASEIPQEAQELLEELEEPETEVGKIPPEAQELLEELEEPETEAAEIPPETDPEKVERIEAALYDLDEGYRNAFQMNADLMEDISNDPALTEAQKERLLAELEQDNQRLTDEKKAYTQDIISGKMDGDDSDGEAKVLRLGSLDAGRTFETEGDQRDLNDIRDKFAAFFKRGTEDFISGKDIRSEALDLAKEHAQEMIDDYCEKELGDILSGEKKSLRLTDTAVFQNDEEFARGIGGEERARGINGYNDGTMSYVKESGPHPIKTAVHEHNHQLSSNDLRDDHGNVTEYRRGVSIDGRDTQVNEALTEFFTRKIMGDDYPANPNVGYKDNMERMETMADAFGLDTLKEAYYQNKPGLLRDKFENVMGSGAWEALSNAFDNTLKEYDDNDIALKLDHFKQFGNYNVDTPTDVIRRLAESEANKFALLFALSVGGGI